MIRQLLASGSVVVGLIILSGLAFGFQLPNDSTTNPNQKRFDFHAETSIGVNDITGKPVINNVKTCVEPSGLFSGFSAISTPSAMSGIFKVGGNEVTWRLNGPVTRSERDASLNKIARVGGSKTSRFTRSNLPAGEYTLTVNAVNNKGSDSKTVEIVLNEENAVQSCGGFLN